MFLMHTVWTEKVQWLILTKKYVITFPCTCIWPFPGGRGGQRSIKGNTYIFSTYATLKGHVTKPDYFLTTKSLN